MKYIVPHPNGGYDHALYWDYLESVRARMPTRIFEFASNPENHDLTSSNSLHDSWLERWTVKEVGTADPRAERSTQIEARFLGSRWDRFLCLTYKNVARYQAQNLSTRHGDLLVHEMRIENDGLFVHELIFSAGGAFLVEFSDLEHRIELQ